MKQCSEQHIQYSSLRLLEFNGVRRVSPDMLFRGISNLTYRGASGRDTSHILKKLQTCIVAGWPNTGRITQRGPFKNEMGQTLGREFLQKRNYVNFLFRIKFFFKCNIPQRNQISNGTKFVCGPLSI
jgi:hypothetical protein